MISKKKRRLGNADADSTRGHGQMLLSSTGLRRHQPQMQEHIDLLLVHDAIDYTRVTKNCRSTAVTVKLCHSTVNNMHVASEKPPEVESKGERDREEKEALVASLLASLLAGPCEDSREGFRTRTSRLWTSWSLLEPSDFTVLWWSAHHWRCCAWFWWCGALLCWQLLSHRCFWDQPSGQCFSCRHCFVAVDVGHPLCGLPWPCHLVVVVVLLAMFRFAFVVRSSRLRATQVSPVVVEAGLHAGQVLFPSEWCVLHQHRFVAVFVWESLEWQCCVAWNNRVRVVAGLVILQEWTFLGTFPPLNTFPTGPRPVFFRLWLSLYFLSSCLSFVFVAVLSQDFSYWSLSGLFSGVVVALSLPIVLWSTCLSFVFVAVLSPSLFFVFGLSLYMSKNVGFKLPWPKKLRQPHAAGAQASALSSMHAPAALLAWLSQYFFWPG